MAMTPNTSPAGAFLYSVEQVRLLDRQAAAQLGVSGFELMRRAGRAAWNLLLQHWPDARSLTVLCGAGNNGGDGYVIAGLAHQQGWAVQLYHLADPAGLKGEAAEAYHWVQSLGLESTPWQPEAPLSGDVLVDALLGIGATGAVRGLYGGAIAAINSAQQPVVAIDIPSGLCADSGMPLGEAVRATLTLTFIGLKRGLLTAQAPDYTGDLYFDTLGVPAPVYDAVPAAARRLDWQIVRTWIEPRMPCAHKGQFGRVLIVGGDEGMGGAALLAAEAAARCGAGLVQVATRARHVPAVLARCPGVMAQAVRGRHDLAPLLERADVVVIGPGLGQGAWSQQLLQATLESNRPLVLDADALNLIAAHDLMDQLRGRPFVMTPHPGEAARLLKTSVAAVQADRFGAVNELQRQCGGVVLLKGAGTLIQGGGEALPSLAQTGNPGMATGGMGDVLSGMLGALWGQGLDSRTATEVGACLHGAAADMAAVEQGYMSLLPQDLLNALPRLLRACDPRSKHPQRAF